MKPKEGYPIITQSSSQQASITRIPTKTSLESSSLHAQSRKRSEDTWPFRIIIHAGVTKYHACPNDSENQDTITGELVNSQVNISNNHHDEQINAPHPKMNNKKRQATAYNNTAREGLEIKIITLDAPTHPADTTEVATFWKSHMLASRAPKRRRPSKNASNITNDEWETYRDKIIDGNDVMCGPRLQLDLLRDWPKLALDRELWREVASRC